MTGPVPLADLMQDAWDYAAVLHKPQRVPGTDLPYLKHLGMVAMEIYSAHALEPVPDLPLAVVTAILHDSIEDQGADHATLKALFGLAVADGVQALSKDPALVSSAAMADSLKRIRLQRPAIWCVKLADRISNLRKPPTHWSAEKVAAYRGEAREILDALGSAHHVLSGRLAAKIEAYPG